VNSLKPVTVAALGLAAIVSACGTQAPPPTPTATALPTSSPTPKPDFEIDVSMCGYGDFGIVTMAGSVTNNTTEPITFLDAAVALIKNGAVVRTDRVSLVNATGENAGILHGLDYESKAGGLAPGASSEWSIQYPLDDLTQPFECEASVTNAR